MFRKHSAPLQYKKPLSVLTPTVDAQLVMIRQGMGCCRSFAGDPRERMGLLSLVTTSFISQR
jgi:hypothetical protein